MATDAADHTPIYLFPDEGTYYFSHFFDRTDLFDELATFYHGGAYRFEVPASELEEVTVLLEDHWFDPVIVDDISRFCVVKEQYTSHAEILNLSVLHWNRRGFNFFVMRDPLAVDQAVGHGATRIEGTDLVVGI